MSKPIQVVRLYDGDAFIGLDVAVDGETIGNVLSATIVSKPEECPKLVVEFALGVNGDDEFGRGFKRDVANQRKLKVATRKKRSPPYSCQSPVI